MVTIPPTVETVEAIWGRACIIWSGGGVEYNIQRHRLMDIINRPLRHMGTVILGANDVAECSFIEGEECFWIIQRAMNGTYALGIAKAVPPAELMVDLKNIRKILKDFESGIENLASNPKVTPAALQPILKPWVMALGLRHQGVLLTAVRGCDTVNKHCPVKALVRAYRETILLAHCGDSKKSKSFIERFGVGDLTGIMREVVENHDSLPHHYLMHLIHASEIVGYKQTHSDQAIKWREFYEAMCNKMHMCPEAEWQLDKRLNADEDSFAKAQ